MYKFALASAAAAALSQTTSADADADWNMKMVTYYIARAQGDAPKWSNETNEWLSDYGYVGGMDTVNLASIESVLYYVQAESTNAMFQPRTADQCKEGRKNGVQYIAFYEVKMVQPNTGLAEFEDHQPIGYCPYATMDGGKVDDGLEAGKPLEAGLITYENNYTVFTNSCVGAQENINTDRGVYPENYWYSFPNSCPQKGWADKTDECREEFTGGLCEQGKDPTTGDCVFSYKILGYVDIDDFTGIHAMGYNNYTDFCLDKDNNATNNGIELELKTNDTTGKIEYVSSIPFWDDALNETANANRSIFVVDFYNQMAQNNSQMTPLPEPADIPNPKCYENHRECLLDNAKDGCKRVSWGQRCESCKANDQSGDCVVAPATFELPTLQKPKTPEPVTTPEEPVTTPEDNSGDSSSGSGDSSSESSTSEKGGSDNSALRLGASGILIFAATLLNIFA